MSNIRQRSHFEEASIQHRSIHIDCGQCEHQGTATCQDCMVTYLCRPDRNSVLIELGEIRALRALSKGGLVPELKLRNSAGSALGR